MARDGFKILDSDMHVMEPADLWLEYIDPAYKDRAPVGLKRWVRDLAMSDQAGSPWGRPPDPPGPRGGHKHLDDQSRFRDDEAHGWSAQVQLQAMDREGIDTAALYPSRGLHTLARGDLAPDFASSLARAYNNWMFDFCAADRSRLIGIGMISPFDMNDAVAEAERCVKQLGFRGVFIRANVVNGRQWYDRYYDPLWTALEKLNVPLGLHESNTSGERQVGDQFQPSFMLRHTFSHPVEQMLAMAAFCGGGVLERHPRLRVAFLEGNCSWLPWLLWRLDEHAEMFADVWSPELTMRPSDYFKRQCSASADSDETPVRYVVDAVGSDNIVYSTDYPHIDSPYPHAVETFLKLPIAPEHKRKILWDNCAALYGIGVAADGS